MVYSIMSNLRKRCQKYGSTVTATKWTVHQVADLVARRSAIISASPKRLWFSVTSIQSFRGRIGTVSSNRDVGRRGKSESKRRGGIRLSRLFGRNTRIRPGTWWGASWARAQRRVELAPIGQNGRRKGSRPASLTCARPQ